MFIVSIVQNNKQIVCEAFQHFEDAKHASFKICEKLNINYNKVLLKDHSNKCWSVYNDSMRVLDDYHVCIFERDILSYNKEIELDSYDHCDEPSDTYDDEFDLLLPGGYDKVTLKPVSMQHIINNPGSYVKTYDMTYDQQWALVFSRLKHRKHQKYMTYDYDKNSSRNLNQADLIKLFYNKNDELVKEIVDWEISYIKDQYGDFDYSDSESTSNSSW